MPSEAFERQRHIIRNTLMVAACFILAAGAGLVRNIVVARQFGIGAELDAYYAAFKLPDFLFTVVPRTEVFYYRSGCKINRRQVSRRQL